MKKITNRKTKLFSVLIIFLVLAGTLVPAYADDGAINVSTGAELDDALKNATSGTTTIRLTADIDAVASVTYASYADNTTIVIDGQGHTIDGKDVQDTGIRFGSRVSLNVEINNATFKNMTNDDNHGGGAIGLWRGNLIVTNSAFIGNKANNASARGSGGALQNENANGTTIITNSTFTGNTATAAGGAINTGSPGTITNVTVIGNSSATGGGGINVSGRTTLPIVTVANSIAINNSAEDITGATDGGRNLTGIFAGAGSDTQTGIDIASTAAWLASQAVSDGGATPTFALLNTPDSPAVDKGIAAYAPVSDQRGYIRDALPDIGAYELVTAENNIDIVPSGSAFGELSFDLTGSFTEEPINLIEVTLKVDPQTVQTAVVVPVEGLTVNRATADANNGTIHIVLGVTGENAIASLGRTVLATLTVTPRGSSTPEAAYVSILSSHVYSKGVETAANLLHTSAYARFNYHEAGDVNGDGVVDNADLSLALYYFGARTTDSDWNVKSGADVNGDGVVDILDITILVDALFS